MPGNHPYAEIFKQNGFPEPVKLSLAAARKGDLSPVAIVDGLKPLTDKQQTTILKYAQAGGTVFMTEASATNRAFLARLGLGFRPRGAVFSFFNPRVGHAQTPFGYRGIVKEPYYKPEKFSGEKPFTDETRARIDHLLDNVGQIHVQGECKENRAFLDAKRVAWREANMDWFTRVGRPALLDGIANSDLYFSKLSLDTYNCWMMRRMPGWEEALMDMYRGLPEAISLGSFYRLSEDSPVVFHTYPAILAEVPTGKGRVIVLSLDSSNFRGKYPQKFIRLYRQLLGNLGVRTSMATELSRFVTTAGVGGANRRLWDDPNILRDKRIKKEKLVPVLFGNGEDLRYFPVNQCGWSLKANNYCPVEPFPQEATFYGGIPFKIPQAPHWAHGASVSVDAGGYGLVNGIRTPLTAKRVWILAAMDKVPSDPKVLSGEKPALSFTWQDAKGARKLSHAYYGKEIGAYMKPIAPTGNGRIGWEGHTGTGKRAVLYAFSMDNPGDPDVPVVSSHITTCGNGVQLALFALTWESN